MDLKNNRKNYRILNFRALPFISLNAVRNEVELRDKQAGSLILFGFGKAESQMRAPRYWLLRTNTTQRQDECVFVLSSQSSVVRSQPLFYWLLATVNWPLRTNTPYLCSLPTLFINPFNKSR